MFHILIDTSVWLDLAADQRQSVLLDLLIEFISEAQATLVLPQTVVDEFHKNRERVAKASARSLSSLFGQVRDAIKRCDGDRRQKAPSRRSATRKPGSRATPESATTSSSSA